MAEPCKHTGNKVLLVEGKNDCHVIFALCKAHGIPESFGLYDCESDDGVLKRLNALIHPTDKPETIGVVLDIDVRTVESRWQQIQGKIESYGYDFPELPNPAGTILPLNGDKPKLGIWLMPNNQNPGMLEDFLMPLANAKSISFAAESVNSAKEKGVTTFKDVHHSKAVIHTYLAWQDEPGKPLGQSITSHVLNPETDIARLFTAWLTELFC
jgi:hypothetical protein